MPDVAIVHFKLKTKSNDKFINSVDFSDDAKSAGEHTNNQTNERNTKRKANWIEFRAMDTCVRLRRFFSRFSHRL